MMKRAISILLLSALCLTMTGCSNNDGGAAEETGEAVAEQAATNENGEAVSATSNKELLQNDFRGGVMRTYALQDGVLKIMDDMKANNTTIRESNPNSFWQAEGYQDFVVNFLNAPIINDLQWFNEEETDWATVTAQMVSVANSFTAPSDSGYSAKYSGLRILRNEKDDYSITGVNTYWSRYPSYTGNISYQVLYDCDKDWCKAYATMTIAADVPEITAEMYEYARIDNNTFVIQTGTERLLVILSPAEQDTSIADRTIKEFYYSKLASNSVRTSFVPYKPLPEYDSATGKFISENERINGIMIDNYPIINENGDTAFAYGANDSVFMKEDILKSITSDWVFEDKSLQQAILYKDDALVVTTYNKLTKKYERFIYALSTASKDSISELENMVKAEELTVRGKETIKIERESAPTETTTGTAATEANPDAENPDSTETPDSTEDTTDAADAERELMNQLQDGDTVIADENGNLSIEGE